MFSLTIHRELTFFTHETWALGRRAEAVTKREEERREEEAAASSAAAVSLAVGRSVNVGFAWFASLLPRWRCVRPPPLLPLLRVQLFDSPEPGYKRMLSPLLPLQLLLQLQRCPVRLL